MVKYHEIRIHFFDKRFRSFMSRTVVTLKFRLRWFPEEAVATQWHIRVAHDGKVGCNTVESTAAFPYSDWLYFYGMVDVVLAGT